MELQKIKDENSIYEFQGCAETVIQIAPSKIIPNPSQPRKVFSERALSTLADSIKRHGVLQPLIVRKLGDCYELIAGERRLRGAVIAGLDTVPCILREADESNSAELAIIENLQREDLNMFEEAEAIRSLIELCSLTQETAAAHLSCSQSYIANKLRLLKLSEDERALILENALTERHARAIIRLRDEEKRKCAIEIISKRKMNVAAAEEYIENLICAEERALRQEKIDKPCRDLRRRLLSKDMRLFYNSIDRACDSVRSCGIPIETKKKSVPEGTVIEILLKT